MSIPQSKTMSSIDESLSIFPNQSIAEDLAGLKRSLDSAETMYKRESQVLTKDLAEARNFNATVAPSMTEAALDRLVRKRLRSEFALDKVLESLKSFSKLGHLIDKTHGSSSETKTKVEKIVKAYYGTTEDNLTRQMVDVYSLAVDGKIMDLSDVGVDMRHFRTMTQGFSGNAVDSIIRSGQMFIDWYKTFLSETLDDGKIAQVVLDSLVNNARLRTSSGSSEEKAPAAISRYVTEIPIIRQMIRRSIKMSFAARIPGHFESCLSGMGMEDPAHDGKGCTLGIDWLKKLSSEVFPEATLSSEEFPDAWEGQN